MIDLSRKKISGYIDHNYNGHKVRLHGDVLMINESDMTAKMRFDNGVESAGIPMEVIEIDEGALSGIKKAANRAWGYIKGQFQKVGGMVRKMVDGEPVPFNRASNIAQRAAEGGLPEGVGIYPSAEAFAEADEAGISITEKPAPEPAEVDSNGFNENEAFNELWRSFIKDQKLEESTTGVNSGAQGAMDTYIRAVNEMYGSKMAESLAHNPSVKDFFGVEQTYESLCEDIEYNAVHSLMEGEGDHQMQSKQSENMPDRTMAEIVQEIMLQLKARYKCGEFDFTSPEGKAWLMKRMRNWSNERARELVASGRYQKGSPELREVCIRFAKEKAKGMEKATVSSAPLMIWGAPGIGKTSIIQQCRAMFKKATAGTGSKESKVKNGYNINMLEVVLSKMSADDFTLPGKGEDELTGDTRAVNGIQSWIPCWQVSGDSNLDKLRDMAANYKMNTASVLAQHGINAKDVRDTIDSFKQGAPSAARLTNNSTSHKEFKDGEWVDVDSVSGSRPSNVEENPMRDAKEFGEEIAQAAAKRRGRPRKNVSESLIYESDDYDEFGDEFTSDVDALDKKDAENENLDNLTDGGIIFFDELTRAPKGVMNVIMNLINDRKVGEGWVLGSHWSMVCAGNRFWEMDGISSTWEKAFGTRFQNVTFVPTYEDWKKWAQGYVFDANTGRYSNEKGTQKIDQEIIDFLDARRMVTGSDSAWYENVDDKTASKDEKAVTYANPRTWQRVSDAMVKYAVEKARRNGGTDEDAYRRENGNDYINLTPEEKEQIIANNLGKGHDSYGEFVNYNKTKFFTPAMKDNIINYGTIFGDVDELTKQIQTTGKARIEMEDEQIKERFIPRNREGRYVHMAPVTLVNMMRELTDYHIKWNEVTNIQLANVLSYFAVVLALYGFDSNAFKKLYQSIYSHLYKCYLKNPDAVSPQVRQAITDCIDNPGGDNKLYNEWMKPAKKVFRFAFAWEGIDDGAEKSDAQINAELNAALHSGDEQGRPVDDALHQDIPDTAAKARKGKKSPI